MTACLDYSASHSDLTKFPWLAEATEPFGVGLLPDSCHLVGIRKCSISNFAGINKDGRQKK